MEVKLAGNVYYFLGFFHKRNKENNMPLSKELSTISHFIAALMYIWAILS